MTQSTLVPVADVADLSTRPKVVRIDGKQLAIFRVDDRFYAIDNRCPHMGYPLAQGTVKGQTLTCDWHNWKFNLDDGKCILRGSEDVRAYPVSIVDGRVCVDLTEPAFEDQMTRGLESLTRGLKSFDSAAISRDAARLMALGMRPAEVMRQGAIHNTEREEFGWGHALAVIADCASLSEFYSDAESSVPVVRALWSAAEPVRRFRLRPHTEPVVADREGEAEFRRLFDAYAAFLRAIAIRGPVLVALDDLHWADKPTLLLLEHVARELTRLRILVVCTYRDTDLSRTHPLSEALATLNREPGFARIVLRGLTRPEVDAYVRETAHVEPRPAVLEKIFEETEGNPFFLAEVVNLLTQEGSLGKDSVSDIAVPDGVKEALGRRLDRLSKEANELLKVSAIVGREFAYDTLTLLGDRTDDALLGLIEESIEARVIEEMEQPGRYRFTHALMQETLLSELSTTRRVRLHGQVGEALERRWGDRAEEFASRLATHFFESSTLTAGHAEKAVRYGKLAAVQSEAQTAWDEAIKHYGHCLLLLSDIGEGNDVRATLLTALGVCQRNVGDAAGARGSLHEALTFWLQAGNGQAVAKVTLELVSYSSKVLLVPHKERVGLVDEALALLGPDEPTLKARLLLARGLALAFEGRAGDELLEAAEIARQHNLKEIEAPLQEALMHQAWHELRIDEARELALRGFEAFDKVGSYGDACHQLDDAALMWFDEGRLDKALAVCSEVLEYARRYQLRAPERASLAQQAAIAFLRAVDVQLRSGGEQESGGVLLSLVASVAADAAGDFSRALDLIPIANDPTSAAVAHGARARCLVHAGDLPAARREVEMWRAPLQTPLSWVGRVRPLTANSTTL